MKKSKVDRNGTTDSGRYGMLRTWVSVILCLGIGVSGCSMFKANSEKTQSDILKNVFAKDRTAGTRGIPGSRSSSNQVQLAGGLSLGDTDNLAFTPDELGSVLDELFEAKKWNSARNLIRIYPDIVTEILIGTDGDSVSKSNLTEVAKLFDEQWGGDHEDSWLRFVKAMKPGGQNSEFAQSRRQFLKLLENNEPDKALRLRLSRSVNENLSVIAHAEALRLEGIAHMLLENKRECRDHFGRAISLLQNRHPYQASQIGLLLGEAHRHAGALDEWKTSWEVAIEIQSQLLAHRGLHDPSFWKQAAFLRPASTPWPIDVIGRLENTLRNENLEFSSDPTTNIEAVVWATIGIQSLKRHESQNAILAFKKSEALVGSKTLKEELQMQQALAMIDGGQAGPASAILLRLGSSPSLLGDRAKAILAALKLQNGSLAQGMNLLQSAIKTSKQWPTAERLRALADYGLAYLMRGREAQGIALLNTVHTEFVKQKSFDHAAQCLANMATYYEKTDQMSLHKEMLARMKRFEAY